VSSRIFDTSDDMFKKEKVNIKRAMLMLQDRDVISRHLPFAKCCAMLVTSRVSAERFTAEIFVCGRVLAQKI